MRFRIAHLSLVLAVLTSLLAPFARPADAAPVAAAPVVATSVLATPGPCTRGTLPHGALSMVCVPSAGWNGDLVVWAHGYVDFTQPVDFYHLELPDGTSLPNLVQGLGFAFATTSYRANGLVVLEGVEDVQELVAAARTVLPRPARRTYLTGASEGGLIAALLAERSPGLFTGILSTCGPIGDFGLQIGYIGDFRVLFDYFFPGVIPGDPIVIPRDVIDNWSSRYEPAVRRAVLANPTAARQLIRTSGAPIDPADPTSVAETAANVLWYNVFGSNDAAAKLGGNPYDNRLRWYTGSDNDWLLNSRVRRAAADPAAVARVAQYQTSGKVDIPLITMHTVRDEVIPYWHQVAYWLKTRLNGKHPLQIPIDRYGHCNFTAGEVLVGFGLLVLSTTNERVEGVPPLPSEGDVRRSFERSRQQEPSRVPSR